VFGDDDDDQDDDILDLSQLGGGQGQDDVESGVTSGADPSSWDPIDIDAPDR
jgi:hypothetical protein